jgi:predicted ATPase
LPGDASLKDLGEHRLKDLLLPEHLYQLEAGSGRQFPPLRSLSASRDNLPKQPNSLVGRAAAVEQLVQVLRLEDVRLVTLMGPAGVGKTRLGLAVAGELPNEFAHGVFLVALAPISDPALVLPAIAHTLGLRESLVQSIEEGLSGYLRDRQILLLLDNFEQVLAAGGAVANLLATCPRIKVLVTSRAPLRLSGEREYVVPPLSLPDMDGREPPSALSQCPSVQLFIDRAVAVRGDFTLTEHSASAVAKICTRLDGLPLAIELAAARVRIFPPEALLARLEHRLSLLTGGPRDLPTRQQTLRDAIGWSYDLLSPAERRLFRRLAVFVGGWTLEAAELICNGANDLGLEVLDGLSSLAEQSLLTRAEVPAGTVRFGMLETVREFAVELLALDEDAKALQRRHAEAQRDEFWDVNPDIGASVRTTETELGNLRAAMDWAQAEGEVETGTRLLWGNAMWFFFNAVREARRRAEEFLALPGASGPSRARALALQSAALMALARGDFAALVPFVDEAITIWRLVPDRRNLAWALACREQAPGGDATARRALGEESIAIFRDLDLPVSLAWAQAVHGFALAQMGDLIEGRASCEAGVALARSAHSNFIIGLALGHLAFAVLQQGDLVAARACHEERAQLLRAAGGAQPQPHQLPDDTWGFRN